MTDAEVAYVRGIEAEMARLRVDLENQEKQLRQLRAALKLAAVALESAECVIDADGEVEAFHQVQTARKSADRTVEAKP
jgi:multidrug resistance efflux pump